MRWCRLAPRAKWCEARREVGAAASGVAAALILLLARKTSGLRNRHDGA